MKKAIASVLCIMMLLSVFPQQGILAADNIIEIYVAPDGDDSALGTIDAPLATLQGAKDKIRGLRKDSIAVNVYFRGGEYQFKDSVQFGEADSGTKDAPITYMAYGDEEPRFTGAIPIETEDFEKVTGQMYQRLPEISRDYVGVVDLKKKGVGLITEFTSETAIARNASQANKAILKDANVEFYFNERSMTLAEWPNGYDNYTTVTKMKSNTEFGGETGGRIKNWVTAENPMVIGFLGLLDYGQTRTKIMEFNLEDETMIFNEGDYGPAYGGGATEKHLLGVVPQIGGKWRIQNLIEELDVPGEFYLDYDNRKLYFYPPYSTVGVEMRLALGEKPLVKMEKTKYVTFKGLTFEKNRENVIELITTDSIQFLSCTVRQFALRGIVTKDAAINTLIDGCDFFTGGNAMISINSREGEVMNLSDYYETNLVKQNNRINNCHFWDFQNQFLSTCESGAINLHGVGGEITNCKFHDNAGNIIRWRGNDHIFQNNEFYNVMKYTHDQGGIYNGRSKVHYGVDISYNYFHDIVSESSADGGAHCIYFDDTNGGGNVHHNILTDVESAFWLRGGPDIKFDNNIIVNNSSLSSIQSLGMKSNGVYRVFDEFRNNQIPLVYSLESFDKYDNLKRIFFGREWPNYGASFKGNLFYGNTVKYPTIENGAAAVGVSNDDNYFYDGDEPDKLFNNMAKGDYTISPNYTLPEGYEELRKIKLENIGNYVSDTRPVIAESLSDFQLYYPYNFTDKVGGENVYLKWEECIGADCYIVEVAFDEEFKSLAGSYTAQGNYIIIEDIPNDASKYYWRVKAIANGKDCEEEKLNSKGPRVFRTRNYDILDKSELQNIVDDIESILDEYTEGIDAGTVAYGSTDYIKNYLAKANEMLEAKQGLQTDIDSMVNLLNKEKQKIGTTVVRNYTGIDSIINAKDSWVNNLKGNGLSHIENGIMLKNTTDLDMSVYTNVAAPIERNKIFCFKMNIDIPDGAGGGTWQAIAFQRKVDAGIRLYHGTGYGYLFIIKNNVIEVQLWNGKQRILDSIPNYFPQGVDSDVKFGVIDFGPGQRIFLEINGEIVFEHTEYVDLLRDDLYFSVYDSPHIAGNVNCNPMKVMLADPEDIPDSDIQLGNKLSVGENDIAEAISSMAGGNELKINNGVKISSEKMDNLKSINFNIKPNLSDEEQGVLFRLSDKEFDESKSNYYKLSFKKGKLILHKNNNGIKQTMSIAKTDKIKSNEWNEVKIYTRFENNGTRIVVTIGDEEIINCLDTQEIKRAGYFGVFNNTASELTVKP